jgi:hypothetical protein
MASQISDVKDKIEAAIWQRSGKREGSEIRFLCFLHDDQKPSARYNPEKATWYCDVCKKGGGYKDVAEKLGIPTNNQKADIHFHLEESYHYELEPNIEYYVIDRKVSDIRGEDSKFEKKFVIKHRVNGQYVFKKDNLRIIPFHLPEIKTAKAAGIPIRDHEGERKADICFKLGLPATSMPFGANAKIEDSYMQELTGAEVYIYPDNDEPGEKYALSKAKALYGKAKSIKIVHLPGLQPKGDIVDFMKAGGTKEQILKIESETPYFEIPKHSLENVLSLFQEFYHLPDTGHIELALAAIAANKGNGDPVWLLIVAPPGWGKTEPLNTVIGLPNINR